jgi:hypothetical protein
MDPVDPDVDELGPVDYLIVEFPPDRQVFTGELGDELLRLVNSETVRLLDLLVLTKGADGTIDAVEIDDSGERDDIRALESHVAEILATDDVVALAEAMEPGSVAGVLVWENTWAAPFASAARRAGGQLVASGRIPVQALVAAFEGDLEGTES